MLKVEIKKKKKTTSIISIYDKKKKKYIVEFPKQFNIKK
jgi:hypothetical protein